MRAYFGLTEVTNVSNNIVIALQRIRGGTANQAENWAGVKMQEFLDFQREWMNRGSVGVPDRWSECRTG